MEQTRTLAILGGPPAFDRLLHVGRPNIGNREDLHARIDEILDRRWLTNHGPMVRELETRIADRLGVRHCVTTTNATLGLEVAIRALGLAGEVIVPSFTFVATAHALRWLGLTPIFCDIDPHTHTIDPRRIEELITPQTSGIIGVHLWGRPCQVADLAQLARRHDLRLIFDAAHAFGATYGGQPVGGFGDAEVFSFHATKFVNAFEGGAITTNDDEFAHRLRLATNFGFENFDSVACVGTNAKMSEAAAAMALTSLDAMERVIAANRANFEAYRHGLADVAGMSLVDFDPQEAATYQYVVVEVDEDASGISRDTLLAVLHAENVLARRYFYPGCHRMEPYRTEQPSASVRLPTTERLGQRVLVLPTGTAVSPREVETICGILRLAVGRAGLVSRVAASKP